MIDGRQIDVRPAGKVTAAAGERQDVVDRAVCVLGTRWIVVRGHMWREAHRRR